MKVVSVAVAGYTAFGEFMTIYEYLEKHNLKADLIISLGGVYSISNFSAILRRFKQEGRIYNLYDNNIKSKINDIQYGSFSETISTFGLAILNLDLYTTRYFHKEVKRMKKKLQGKTRYSRSNNEILNYQEDKVINQLYKRLFIRENTNYKMMNLLAESHNSHFMLFLLPLADNRSNLHSNSAKRKRERWFVNRFQDDLMEQNSQFPVIDLRGVFKDLISTEKPFPKTSSGHYTVQETRVISNSVITYILTKLSEINQIKSK